MGGHKKIGQSLMDTLSQSLPFSKIFNPGFCSDGPCECSAKFEVRSFTHSWHNWGFPKNWLVRPYCECSSQIWST